MTLYDRAEAYNALFGRSALAASRLHVVKERGQPVIYGTWVLGNDYRNKTTFYGAYPPGYLKRVRSLFPDVDDNAVLHVFSGSMPKGDYTRCDAVQDAEFRCRIEDLPVQTASSWPLILADPPYSQDDAKRYHVPMINRRTVMEALACVIDRGGFLAWLDTVWPMHRRTEWRTAGRIAIVRSTNHRVRMLTLFERQV